MPQDQDNIKDAFDGPWKEALRLFFRDALDLLAPALSAHIDWGQPFVFLDRELQKLQPKGRGGHKVVDVLTRVSLLHGGESFVLIHAEVQADPDHKIAERMFRYRYLAFDKFELPIESILILADTRPDFRPDHFLQQGIISSLRLDFLPVKLLDFEPRWTELRQSHNPFALFIMAHLKAKRIRTGQQRLYWKTWLVRRLYDRGYSRERVIQLFQLVDWLLRLPPGLEQRFRVDLRQIEEKQQMKYVSSIEKMGREEGLKEGLKEGLEKGREKGREAGLREGTEQATRNNLLQILEARFGPVADGTSAALARIHDMPALEGLIRIAAVTDSPDSFARALAEFEGQ